MTDRVNQENASEAVGAETRYKLLMEKYETLLAEANQWKIKFEATVIPNGDTFEIDAVASLGNGKGVRKTLNMADIVHFKDDPTGLSTSLADQMLEALLGKKAREELASRLVPAIQNVVKRGNL